MIRPSSSRPLHRRLESLTLGLTAAAATGGATLPQKAEATYTISVTGIQVNDTDLFVPGGFDYVNIGLDVYNLSEPIQLQSYFGIGWNLRFGFYGGDGGGGIGIGNELAFGGYYLAGSGSGTDYQFLNNAFTAPSSDNLATIGSAYWTDAIYLNANSGETYYLGLRQASGTYYGWVQVQTGSITHLQSAFNFDPNGAIGLGQVPEPSRAALLASGLAGVALSRRRRKTTA